MTNLFFSQNYIDAHMEILRELLPDALISDATYKNDECASIQIKVHDTTYLLFIPNSFVTDEEKENYAYYKIILDKEYAEEKTFHHIFDNISSITYLI